MDSMTIEDKPSPTFYENWFTYPQELTLSLDDQIRAISCRTINSWGNYFISLARYWLGLDLCVTVYKNDSFEDSPSSTVKKTESIYHKISVPKQELQNFMSYTVPEQELPFPKVNLPLLLNKSYLSLRRVEGTPYLLKIAVCANVQQKLKDFSVYYSPIDRSFKYSFKFIDPKIIASICSKLENAIGKSDRGSPLRKKYENMQASLKTYTTSQVILCDSFKKDSPDQEDAPSFVDYSQFCNLAGEITLSWSPTRSN
jgi:hypothetical protein